ncbi:hypothetical protein L0664_13675 [Octadecabacter sp. G9-8]|uniref:Uncharacterized protein n=1 Tax=Octadecabacter dasysiphoniae TaxID=2909341 RepID=A0ABS9CXX3_9RHOB|nr:hypothetical protein [Octadecabacter dasysiphoniae]MCF2872120.1 hypothetical protein [Octadecabacter dasysiphoniae]
MKFAALIALTTLAACANPQAPENPNSVPSIQRTMLEMRRSGPHISVTGGVFEGAAAGQRTAFVATPDDRLICTFQSAPDPNRTGLTATVTGYRLNVPGIYTGLSFALLPNVSVIDVETTEAFAVQMGAGAGATSSSIGIGDPRLEQLTRFFAANPTPCWAFG